MRQHMDPQLARILALMPTIDLSDIKAIRALNRGSVMPSTPTIQPVKTTEMFISSDESRIRIRLSAAAGFERAPAGHPALSSRLDLRNARHGSCAMRAFRE